MEILGYAALGIIGIPIAVLTLWVIIMMLFAYAASVLMDILGR